MLREPNKVQYFVAVTFNPSKIKDPTRIIESEFGDAKHMSDIFLFDHTKYYEPEMGENLLKFFVAFNNVDTPDILSMYKHKAIKIEDRLSVESKRTINIDPGYLAIEKVVVASTKNFTHRIYLSNGIFGDLQLMRQKSSYVAMPWTYADYIREESLKFFKHISQFVGARK